jgi:outer membrane receptor for ferrienterochelin and colicins
MQAPRLLRAGPLLAWVLLSLPASAQISDTADEGGLAELLGEEVGSSASRTAQSQSDSPGTTWSISGTDLKRYGIQSVEEAIRYLGHAMTSYEYDQRQNTSITGRGFSDATLGLHLAVLIDGNQAGGSAKTARASETYLMPIELIDHIEVVVGPGSVVYGNNAMLGVINVITRTGASINGTHAVLQTSGGTPGDPWARDLSWGELWGRAAVYSGGKTTLAGETLDYAWHFAARADRQQGRSVWRVVGGVDPYENPFGAYTREDAFNRDFGARLFARATWGHWSLRAWAAYGVGTGTGAIEGTGGSSYTEPEVGVDVTWAKPVFSRGDLSLRFYAVMFDSKATTVPDTIDRNNCLNKVGVATCYDTLDYIVVRPFIEPLFTWDWNRDGSHVSTVGGQLYLDGNFITTGNVASDGTKASSDGTTPAPLPNAAVFAQHIWRGKLGVLNVGLRGDFAYQPLSSSTTDGTVGWNLSPRIAFIRDLWSDSTLKLVGSTGFRTPTLTEKYLNIPGFLTENDSLGPERVYSGELDLSQRVGVHNLQLAAFVTYWDQLITTHQLANSPLQQFANLRSIWAAGINFAWRGAKGPIDWGLSLNYAPGRVRLPQSILMASDTDLQMQRIDRDALTRYGSVALGSVFLQPEGSPDFYATGHVSYSLGEELPRISIAANIQSPRPRSAYLYDPITLDPRSFTSAFVPWTLDLRTALEHQLTPRVGLRLIVTVRTFATNATSPRIGTETQPYPGGSVGSSANPVAPASAMLEANFRL